MHALPVDALTEVTVNCGSTTYKRKPVVRPMHHRSLGRSHELPFLLVDIIAKKIVVEVATRTLKCASPKDDPVAHQSSPIMLSPPNSQRVDESLGSGHKEALALFVGMADTDTVTV